MAICGAHAAAVPSVKTAEFGTVRVRAPTAAADFAIYFSGVQGLRADDEAAIGALAGAGIAIAVIDTAQAIALLARRDDPCIDIAGPLEWLGRNAQHALGGGFHAPILVGRGIGAALVYVALAQAGPLAFRGGASLDLQPHLRLSRPFCGLVPQPLTALPPGVKLNAPWLLDSGGGAREAEIASYRKSSIPRVRVPAPGGTALDKRVGAAVDALIGHPGTGPSGLADLPLVEVGLQSRRGMLVVILSGDGGWRDLDKRIAEVMAGQGYAVVGFDCLRYFWSRRTPAQAAADLDRVLAHYLHATGSREAVLVGYSFGADVLPFLYNRLADARRRQVRLVALLAPGLKAGFEIHLDEWFGDFADPQALPTAPELRAMPPGRVQCIYGTEEGDDSLCRTPQARGTRVEAVVGGHHFDGDFERLSARIESAIGAAEAAN